jgi:hypothetical protein
MRNMEVMKKQWEVEREAQRTIELEVNRSNVRTADAR